MSNPNKITYTYPCPWCKTRLQSDTQPERSICICGHCEEFYGIESADNRGNVVVVRIPKKVIAESLKTDPKAAAYISNFHKEREQGQGQGKEWGEGTFTDN